MLRKLWWFVRGLAWNVEAELREIRKACQQEYLGNWLIDPYARRLFELDKLRTERPDMNGVIDFDEPRSRCVRESALLDYEDLDTVDRMNKGVKR